jgi:5-methylcytosine-specific restriction endonuclease McrBC regulatory subunit McrC
MSVPVDKIFLMLSYVAGYADWFSMESVASAGEVTPSEYLGRLLAEAGERSVRQGLPHHYSATQIRGRTLRGRIDFPQQIKVDRSGGVSLCCISEVAGCSSIATQVLKAAAVRLSGSGAVSNETAGRLQRLAGILDCGATAIVSPFTLNAIRSLRTGGIHQAAAFVAWLVLSEQGFEAGDDGQVYGWPKSPQQQGLLFQEFVRMRLQVVSTGRFDVRSIAYTLPLPMEGGGVRAILPELHTDIVLSNAQDILVVEVKLMPPLVASRWSKQGDKLRADHLSQLLAYLEHAAIKNDGLKRVRGVLLYGATADRVLARFPLGKHEVSVVSVDLRDTVDQTLSGIDLLADIMHVDEALNVPIGGISRFPFSMPPPC